MNRREFLKRTLEGIVIGSIPLISSCANLLGPDNGIEYYMQTDKSTYKLGEKVEISYKVTNLGSKEVTLHTYRDPEFNILINKRFKETVWAAIHGWKWFSPGVTISPGETLLNPRNWSKKNSSPYIWDMRYDESGGDNKGKLVGQGRYNVTFVVYELPKIEFRVPITIIKD